MNKMVDEAILLNQARHLFKVNTTVQLLSSEDLGFMIIRGLITQTLR